jgi:putative spermidine/putrescine transport system permease protein
MVLPLLVLSVIFFDLPLAATFLRSLSTRTDTLTLDNYVTFFNSSLYLSVVIRTIKISLIVALACALLGFPLCYWTTTLSRTGSMIVLGCVVASFWVSILVRTYSWIVILGNGGIVNRWLLNLGWINQPIEMLYGEFGVSLGMINVLLPFLVLPLYAAMKQIDPRLRLVSLTLGASDIQYFWRVFFPLILPSLTATTILVFILSIGFYITPAILGGGRVPVIATMLELLINRFPNWGLAAAISVVLLGFTMVAFAFYQWFKAKSKY